MNERVYRKDDHAHAGVLRSGGEAARVGEINDDLKARAVVSRIQNPWAKAQTLARGGRAGVFQMLTGFSEHPGGALIVIRPPFGGVLRGVIEIIAATDGGNRDRGECGEKQRENEGMGSFHGVGGDGAGVDKIRIRGLRC